MLGSRVRVRSSASEFLKARYMFWSNQKPHFAEDVLPCFADGGY